MQIEIAGLWVAQKFACTRYLTIKKLAVLRKIVVIYGTLRVALLSCFEASVSSPIRSSPIGKEGVPKKVINIIFFPLFYLAVFIGEKYEPILVDNTYKVTMRLTIRGVSASGMKILIISCIDNDVFSHKLSKLNSLKFILNTKDYGTYVCLSKNSLGETDGQIKLYRKSSKQYHQPPRKHVLSEELTAQNIIKNVYYDKGTLPLTLPILGKSQLLPLFS